MLEESSTSGVPAPYTRNSECIHESITRLAYHILFSEMEYVLLPDILEFFPLHLSNIQIKSLLLDLDNPSCPYSVEHFTFRFIDQGGDELLIGLVEGSEYCIELFETVETWKRTMCQVLEKLGDHEIEFSTFENIVPRPAKVPEAILLKDVLRSDFLRRFSWYGPADNICIQGPLKDEVRRQLIKQKLEDALTRARCYILFSKRDFVRLEMISHCFPTMFLWRDIYESISNDPLNRFKVVSRMASKKVKEYFVGIASQVEWDQLLLNNVDEWRNAMVSQLEKSDSKQLQLSILARDRPDNILQHKELRKKAKIFDVVRSDPSRRFSISGLPINWIVTLNPHHSLEETKKLESKWRSNVFSYFQEKKRSKLLIDLERNVRRPFGLNSELCTVLSSPKGQFTITLNSRGLQMVTVSPPSDEFNAIQLEKWRNRIFEYLIATYGPSGPQSIPLSKRSGQIFRERTRQCKISELVNQVREPWPLVWNGSIVSILEDDPIKRFILQRPSTSNSYYVTLNSNSCHNSSHPTTTIRRTGAINEPSNLPDGRHGSHGSQTSKSRREIGIDEHHVAMQGRYLSQRKILRQAIVPEDTKHDLEHVWRTDLYNHLINCMRPLLPSDLIKYVSRPPHLDDSKDLFSVLESDPETRFCYSKTSKGIQVVSLRISDEDKEEICEEWRSLILKQMLELPDVSAGQTISKIGKQAPRPWLLSRPLTLQDVLRDDPLKRFHVEGTGDDVKVFIMPLQRQSLPTQRRAKVADNTRAGIINTAEKKQNARLPNSPQQEEWCRRTAIHIAWHRHAFVRENIGDVGIPPELVNSDLIALLKDDYKERFSIVVTSKGMQAVNLCITQEECQGLINDWRKDVFNYFLLATKDDPEHAVEISKVACFVARPWLLPKSCSLYDVLKSDPTNSFILTGGGTVTVSLNMKLSQQSFQDVDYRMEDAVIKRILGFNFNDYISHAIGKREEQSIDPTDRGELFRKKVYQYLLWHRNYQVPLSTLAKHIKSDFQPQQLGLILEKDPMQRFHCILRSSESTRSINLTKVNGEAITEKMISFNVSDASKQVVWEKWLDIVASHLENQSRLNPRYSVSIAFISHSLPGQWFLPNSPQLLQYILQNDHLNRFDVNTDGIGDDNVAQSIVRLTKTGAANEQDLNSTDIASCPFAKSWRDEILLYLNDRKKAQIIYDIEVNVPRPRGMLNTMSMVKVLQSDPEHRFLVFKNPRSIRYVVPAVSINEVLKLLEEWKFNILCYMLKRSSSSLSPASEALSFSVSSILKNAPRHWLIPKQFSVFSLLDSDLRNRFVCKGKDDKNEAISLSQSVKDGRPLLLTTFEEYFTNLDDKFRIPTSFVASCYSKNAEKLTHFERSSSVIEKAKSITKTGSVDSNEDASSMDSDDRELEEYILAAIAMIRKNQGGVSQIELDRTVPKPKYVINSFHTLLSEKQQRFVETRNSRNMKVISLSLSPDEAELLTEGWLSDMYHYIENTETLEGGVTTHTLARCVARPFLLPRQSSLRSLLANDKKGRFIVHSSGKKTVVSIVENDEVSASSKLTRGTSSATSLLHHAITPCISQPTASDSLNSSRSTNFEMNISANFEADKRIDEKSIFECSDSDTYVTKVGLYLKNVNHSINQIELDQKFNKPHGVDDSFHYLATITHMNYKFKVVDDMLSLCRSPFDMSPFDNDKCLETWKLSVLDLVINAYDEDPWRRVTIKYIREKINTPSCRNRNWEEDALKFDPKCRFTVTGAGDLARVVAGRDFKDPSIEGVFPIKEGFDEALNNQRRLNISDSDNSDTSDCGSSAERKRRSDILDSIDIIDSQWGSMNMFQSEGEDPPIYENFVVEDFLMTAADESSDAVGGMSPKNVANHIDIDDLMMGRYDIDDLVDVSRSYNGFGSRTSGEKKSKMPFLQHLSQQQLESSAIEPNDSTMNYDENGEGGANNTAESLLTQSQRVETHFGSGDSSLTTPSKSQFSLSFPSPQSLTNGFNSGVNIVGTFHGIFSSNPSLLAPNTPTIYQSSLDYSSSDHSSPPGPFPSLKSEYSDSLVELSPSNASPTHSIVSSPISLCMQSTPPRSPASTAMESPLSPSTGVSPRTPSVLSISQSNSPRSPLFSGMPPPPPGLECVNLSPPISPRKNFEAETCLAQGISTPLLLPSQQSTSPISSGPPTSSLPHLEPAICRETKDVKNDVNNWASVVAKGNGVSNPPEYPPSRTRKLPSSTTVTLHKRNIYSTTDIYELLKIVFCGMHDADFLKEMNCNFGKDGLHSCGDLLQADAHNKLTRQLMESWGYSLDHLEMILMALDWIKEEPNSQRN